MNVETSVVTARGVGRKDYSGATEMSVEPLISSWQSVYLYHEGLFVPAGGYMVRDVETPLNQVVLLYDFFASIPANRLIRLKVEAVDALGVPYVNVDETAFQTVTQHISKGYPFFKTIRFTAYNYGDDNEWNFWIGCAGLYTSEEQYYVGIIGG